MEEPGKEGRNATMWYWIIGTLIVIGLIWWWVEAADKDVAEPAEMEMEGVGSLYLQHAPENEPIVYQVS